LRRDLLDVGQPADGDLLAVGRGLEMRRRRRRAGGDAGELAPAPAKRAAANRWGLRRRRAAGRPPLGLLRVWLVPSFVHGLQ